MTKWQRTIYQRITRYEESATMTTRTLSWRRDKVHDLTLSCGHRMRFRGDRCPANFTTCKACQNGRAEVSLEGVKPGVFDKTVKAPIAHPVVAALLEEH
jgi:hypothetical protein